MLSLVLVVVSRLILLRAAPAPVPVQAGLELRLKTSTTHVKGGKAVWEVRIVNCGKKTVTLVQPGDGSDCGWRTPIVEWVIDGKVPGTGAMEVREVVKDGRNRKPELQAACLTDCAQRIARCGNINALKANEVFDIPPSKEVGLNAWVGFPPLDPGKHKVIVRYFNLPEYVWKGKPLGEHDKKAMQRVKNSLKAALESNPFEIMVEK
jgi:hypothetical protein